MFNPQKKREQALHPKMKSLLLTCHYMILLMHSGAVTDFFPSYKVLVGRELKPHWPEGMTVNPALVIQYCIIRICCKDLTGGR